MTLARQLVAKLRPRSTSKLWVLSPPCPRWAEYGPRFLGTFDDIRLSRLYREGRLIFCRDINSMDYVLCCSVKLFVCQAYTRQLSY